MNVDAAHVQLYVALSMSPWSIKPVVGVLSDILIVRGYHKRFYLIQCIVIGFCSAMALIFIPHRISLSLLIVLGFFGLHYETSISDLLSEGTYAKIMQEHPETGTDIITLVNAFQAAGQLIALCFVGPLSDINLFYPIFIVSLLLAFSPFIPTLLGWLPEKKEDTRKCILIDYDIVKKNKLALSVVALTGLSAPILAFLTIYVNHIVGLVCAGIMISLSITGSYIAFPRMVGHVALFQVITKIGKPSLGSAMDFFYTSDAHCVPGGPAFSFKYYIMYTGILGAIVIIITSIWIYPKWMSKWKFRSVLIFTSILVGLTGISDLLIVLRINIQMGIPDKLFYIIGEAILENAVFMLYWIPSSAIISKVCKPGMESATYAFLAGISNFGGMTSSMLGAIVFKTAGVKTTLGHCNFDNLWILIIICHIILPVITGVSASFLIPNIRQTDTLLHTLEEEGMELEIELTEQQSDSEFYVSLTD